MKKVFSPTTLFSAACAVGLVVCACSIDDSTDLGSALIRDRDSNAVSLSKHLRSYVMDSAAFLGNFSLPGVNDTGFGIHPATGSYLVIGAQGGERAAGYVQFTCPPDTGGTKNYAANDTVRKITLHFTRDSAINLAVPRPVTVWFSHVRSHALNPSLVNGDSLLGTMTFSKDTTVDTIVSMPDSIMIGPGALADSIFKACSTKTKDSLFLVSRPIIGFIVATLNTTDTILHLGGTPSLTVKYTRGTDTASKYMTYSSTNTSYYIAADGSPDSLQKIPFLSYASKRTAVFNYTISALWDTVDRMANPSHAQVVSALFSLHGPKRGDTVNVRYLVCPTLVRDGVVLDSLFNSNPSKPGVLTINDTSLVQANVCQGLEWFVKNGRPSSLYLYLRFAEDTRQQWKKTQWMSTPLLTATIAVP